MLGSRMGHKVKEHEQLEELHARIATKINQFNSFGLTVHGRAMLTNSCLLSHLWFAASFLFMGDDFLNRLRSECYRFIMAGSPGYRHESRARCEARRGVGGLGVLNPLVEVRAIRAMWVVRMLRGDAEDAATPRPWRQLLWTSLLRLANQRTTDRFNIFRKDWPSFPFYDPALPKPLATAKGPAYHSLLTEILRDFSRCQPEHAPPPPRVAWAFSPTAGSFKWVTIPPLPTAGDLDNLRLCNGKKLEELSVKKIYKFLLAQDRQAQADADHLKWEKRATKRAAAGLTPEPEPLRIDPDSPIPPRAWLEDKDPASWKRRWLALKQLRMPTTYKQLLWRRWHGRLYLGATKEQPQPECPLCGELDSQEHFGRGCEVAGLLSLLQSLWRHWFDAPFPEEWWVLEWGADWRWNTLFATALHTLYCLRYGVIRGDCSFSRIGLALRIKANLTAILDVLARQPNGLIDHDGKWIRLKAGEDPANEKARREVCISFPFP
ncbi:MAG TPA: hypothetical protein VHE33_19060 [Acidobacteriaceae bacterium]|nr:hypothetical protein [Acidobacteriaceae bacterium]